MKPKLSATPKISVVVVFYNMRREAARTLFALTTQYQRGVDVSDYEVIAVDSNSSAPLDRDEVCAMQPNFQYMFVAASNPTPVEAMNAGIKAARGRYIACVIDGARIPTPGILAASILASETYHPAYIMTLGMHLGPKRQNLSMLDGYNQSTEDALLDRAEWEEDGYRLFDCSALAGSSRNGFCDTIAESNFYTGPRDVLQSEHGLLDESFITAGGGLVNLDIHNRLITNAALTPVLLLGEATFHQFHGGVSTNVPKEAQPLDTFKREYEKVRGEPYRTHWRRPVYLGHLPDSARRFLLTPEGEPWSG